MTQIVDLMADVRWSEADIVNRMEALIRSTCSATEELILHRKMLGAFAAIAGVLPAGTGYALTSDELTELGTYALVCHDAQAAGRQARLDAALLDRVLDHELGIAQLATDDADGQALLDARVQARGPVDVQLVTLTDPAVQEVPAP